MFALCRPKYQGSTPRGTPGNFSPKWPPVDLSVGDIRLQIVAKWLQIAQWAQWRAYRKPFEWCHCQLPTISHPPNGVPYAPRYANGHISITGDPIHFMFGSRVGFQGLRIEWHYFWLHQIQVGGRPPSWIISNGHLHNGSFDPLIQRILRGHLCDSTAFLFLLWLLTYCVIQLCCER